jgi:hypothetical protein
MSASAQRNLTQSIQHPKRYKGWRFPRSSLALSLRDRAGENNDRFANEPSGDAPVVGITGTVDTIDDVVIASGGGGGAGGDEELWM